MTHITDFLTRNRYATAFTLGSLLTLGLPPVGFAPVIFVAFPLLMWLVASARNGRNAFFTGWAFGSGYFVIGLYWFSIGFTEMYHQGTRWPLTAAAFGPTIYVALYWAAAAAVAFHFRKKPLLYALTTAICLFWAEYALGHEPAKLPWNLLGAVWYHALPVMQSLSVVGIYGLTFLTLLWATVPYLIFHRQRHAAWLMTASFLLIAIAGGARLLLADNTVHPGVSIRILQANVTRDERLIDDYAMKNETLARHIALMKDTPAGTSLVLWPESVIDVREGRHEKRYAEIARHLPAGAYAAVGIHRFVPRKGQRDETYSSLVLLDDKGRVQATYDKKWLVPWGEYVPFDSLLSKTPLRKHLMNFTRMTPGPGPRTLTAGNLPSFTPMICYEAVFTGVVTPPDARPAFLFTASNDAWTSGSVGPLQNHALMRLRAIEEGLPVLRAANIGISSVTDAYGRELQRLGMHAVGVIDTPLPQALPATFYARYKDTPLLAFMLLLSGIVLYLQLQKRRS